MKEFIRRLTRRGAESAPEPEPSGTTEAAPKLPPELPLFFMLSHLDDDGPVRLDGVKLGVCEVMGLEIDEPKLGAFAGALNALDFPAQLLIRQHPPRLGGLRENLKQAQPADLPPQTRAAAESLGRLLTDLEARDGILDRRFYAVCEFGRIDDLRGLLARAGALRTRAPGPPASDDARGRRPGRLPLRVRRGDAGRGRDQPARRARRREPRPLPAPGPLAPVIGPRLPPRAHGGGRADGPVRPRRSHTCGAGGEDAGMAEGALRVGPVPVLQAGPHHVPRGGDRPGGHHPAQGRGAAGQGAALPRLAVGHAPCQGRGVA